MGERVADFFDHTKFSGQVATHPALPPKNRDEARP